MADNILVIGGGSCATQTAALLLQNDLNVIIASGPQILPSTDNHDLEQVKAGAREILTSCRLIACTGGMGAFDVQLEQNGDRLQREVATIVIAEENDRQSNISRYGLLPTEKIVSLATFNKMLANNPRTLLYKTVAFINGLAGENIPFIFREMAVTALSLRKNLVTRTYFLTHNLKVAGDGLEALYRDAKQAGVVFFKLSGSSWGMQPTKTGGARIEFTDDLLNQSLVVFPDITVFDDTLAPSGYLRQLAHTLDLHCDSSGFPQTENVHRLPVYTNRKGILVAGPSRGVFNPHGSAADTAAVVGAVLAERHQLVEPAFPKAFIDTAMCVRCLTCLRLCPHKAVTKNTAVSVFETACEGCGICVAECPRGAITIDTDWPDHHQDLKLPPASADKIPITLFCCSRSAMPALLQDRKPTEPLPDEVTIVEVPCTGSISQQQLLEAFARGARGVLVLGCHEGNCHSEIGTMVCRNRLAVLSEQLTVMGFDQQRLSMATLAAQMKHDAENVLKRFVGSLKNLDTTSESPVQ